MSNSIPFSSKIGFACSRISACGALVAPIFIVFVSSVPLFVPSLALSSLALPQAAKARTNKAVNNKVINFFIILPLPIFYLFF